MSRKRSEPRESASRPSHALPLALLALVVGLAYANSYQAGLIYDNRPAILFDPRIQAPTAANLRRIFSEDYWGGASTDAVSGLFRPVTTLSYLVNWSLLGNGPRPFGYHLVNHLLHLGNAWLVYALGLAFLGDRRPAWLAAALFAVHPLGTEAVTNVIGRADLLGTASVLAGLLFHLRASRSGGGRRVLALTGLGLSTLAGVFAKENAVVVVPLIVAADFARGSDRGERRRNWLASGLATAPALLAMAVARGALFARLPLPEIPPADNPLVLLDPLAARLSALAVVARGLALVAWPARLSCDYSYDCLPLYDGSAGAVLRAAFGGLALLALAVLGWRYRRSRPPLSFFALFALIALLPTANLVRLIGSILAERFYYLPLVGLAGLVVTLAFGPAGRRPVGGARERVAAALLLAAVVVLGIRTWLRNRDWRDEVRLFASAVEACPRSARAHASLALALDQADAGRSQLDRAIAAGERALAISDLHVPGLQVLANVLLERGDQEAVRGGDPRPFHARARDVLLRAIAVDRAAADRVRQGEIARGHPPETVPERGRVQLYSTLATAQATLGDRPAAVRAFAAARRFAPSDGGLVAQQALARRLAGDLDGAARDALAAYLLDPRPPERAALLKLAYGEAEGGDCALVEVPGGVRLNPECPLVARHTCQALSEIATACVEARRPALAAQARARLAATPGCGPATDQGT